MTTLHKPAAIEVGSGPDGLMERLKRETHDLHTRAERGEIQRALVKGTATREQYAAWLGQMLLLHEATEAAIDRCRAGSVLEALEGLPAWRQSLLGREDLAALGQADPAPLPATAALAGEIAGCDSPLRILGFFYVLEGANNGNRFIARAVRKSLALGPGEGDRFLDPYGDAQPQVWAEVKARLNALDLSQDEQDEVVAGAVRMFEMVIEAGHGLADADTAAA